MLRIHKILTHVSLATLLAWSSVIFAADVDPVVARNSTTDVRLSEFKAEIEQRVPPDMRAEFLSSRKRVNDILTQVLMRKSLAAQAKAEKLDQTPANVARMHTEIERTLAQFRIAAVEEKAIADFDAKLPQQVTRAREVYLVDREKYRTPELVSASHILFDTKKHTSDEARALAAQARARVIAGADFSAVAKEVSEDPSAATNGGSLGWFKREAMDPAFAEAAFTMTQVGALSEPVKSTFGWHIIRLDGRQPGGIKPFDEVRNEILDEMRKGYAQQQRTALLEQIRDDPKADYNQEVLDEYVSQARKAPAAGAAAKP